MAQRHSCEVAVVGAGLSGLYAAKLLAGRGIDVLVFEAQDRVGGRTLTHTLPDGAFIDDGGQWVSPGQHRIVALASELGVSLFPSWSDGATVHLRAGNRQLCEGLFAPGEERAAAVAAQAAQTLAAMARTIPLDSPWTCPSCAEWDGTTLDAWLRGNVNEPRARDVLTVCFLGIFARSTPPASLLSALFWAASGDPLAPFVPGLETGPERRFVGGAQQLSERMADILAGRIMLRAPVLELTQESEGILIESRTIAVQARLAIVTLPPPLAVRLRFNPPLPLERDHLGQRAPMRWGIKIHAIYANRFWTHDGLSGVISTDSGLVRTTADNSPPSGSPGILVGFVAENDAQRLRGLSAPERHRLVTGELARYFGPRAARPLQIFERNWGEDAYCRGIDGGYWPVGVWSRYGSCLRAPFGRVHWAGTETSSTWPLWGIVPRHRYQPTNASFCRPATLRRRFIGAVLEDFQEFRA